jgi:hypothetical protein
MAHDFDRALVKQKAASDETTDKELLDARLKLRRDLNKWRRTQLDLYPKLVMENDIISAAKPECDSLLLPSNFSEPQRQSLGLGELANVEYALREGQAYDALDKLCLAIQTFNHNLKFKVDQVCGQGANTRAQAFLRTLSSNKINAADKYWTARTALLALGLQQMTYHYSRCIILSCGARMTVRCQAREIQGRRTRGSGWSDIQVAFQPKKRLDGRLSVSLPFLRSCPWFSRCHCTVNRVKWFRERAACDRAREEKEILEEEFR